MRPVACPPFGPRIWMKMVGTARRRAFAHPTAVERIFTHHLLTKFLKEYIPTSVRSSEGSLSRSDPELDRARAGRTGAPRIGRWTGGQGGAPGGAAPYVTGRARLAPWPREQVALPAQDVSRHPWRLPPLHPLARFARDWQTSDALRRENAEAWLFEIAIRN